MLLHAFLLSRQTYKNKERDEGQWIFFFFPAWWPVTVVENSQSTIQQHTWNLVWRCDLLFWAVVSCSFFFFPPLIKSKIQGLWGRVVQNSWKQLPFCSAKGKTFASLDCLFRLSHSQRGNPWVIRRGSSDSHHDMGLKFSFEVLWGKAHSFARGLQCAFRVISESKLQDSPVVLSSSVFPYWRAQF